MVTGLAGRHLQTNTIYLSIYLQLYLFTINMKKTINPVNQSGLVATPISSLQFACATSFLSMQSMRCCCWS